MSGISLIISLSNTLALIVLLIILILLAYVFIYLPRLISENRKLNTLNADLKAKSEELAVELENVKKKAEESDNLKTSFLANMSHEIRTPLNAIMGFSSLLQQVKPDDEEYGEYVEIINKNSNKLLDMMDEVFNIALIESGITSMYLERCPVNELLTGLVTFFNLEKENEGKENVAIKIKKLSRDSSFCLYTDPRKLRQTLYNLIENALKYTHEGTIEIGYDLIENSMVRFYVKDTGEGFPQEKLDVIFQRFRQVDDSSTRNYGGIGLGLTLSQKFVEMMGGSMWGESSTGKGSVFYFTLPYEPIDVIEAKSKVQDSASLNL
jgi:signal transduction histidine kinase